MAGYSGTPLPKKLGIGTGSVVAFIDAPDEFPAALGELPPDVKLAPSATKGLDVLVVFTRERKQLAKRFRVLANRLKDNGGFWVSWPKKTSGVPTDLTEDVVREIALAEGLVDNKV